MKKTLFYLVLLIAVVTNAQVGINTNTPDASAALEISSSDKGMLTPRLTGSQRMAITTPAQGLLVFQTDGASGFYYYNGGWQYLNNNSLWSEDSGNITNANTGNVGIGTTSPSAVLEIEPNTTNPSLTVKTTETLESVDQSQTNFQTISVLTGSLTQTILPNKNGFLTGVTVRMFQVCNPAICSPYLYQIFNEAETILLYNGSIAAPLNAGQEEDVFLPIPNGVVPSVIGTRFKIRVFTNNPEYRMAYANTGNFYPDGEFNLLGSNRPNGALYFKTHVTGDENTAALHITNNGKIGFFTDSPSETFEVASAATFQNGITNNGDLEVIGNTALSSTLIDTSASLTVSNVTIPLNAGTGKVLTSDANGVATWEDSSLAGSAPIPILLNAGYSNSAAPNDRLQYKLDRKRVYLQGFINKDSGNFNTSDLLFNLPLGYRPQSEVWFTCASSNGTIQITIDINGNVTVGNTYSVVTNILSLSGISFDID